MKVLICLHLPLWISHRRLIITSQYRCCLPGSHDLGLSMCHLEKGRPGVKTVSSNRRRRRRVHVRFMFPVKAGQGRVGSRSRLWSLSLSSVQFSHSVVSTLCDPMNRSTPGLPVHHQLLEFTQTHVH